MHRLSLNLGSSLLAAAWLLAGCGSAGQDAQAYETGVDQTSDTGTETETSSETTTGDGDAGDGDGGDGDGDGDSGDGDTGDGDSGDGDSGDGDSGDGDSGDGDSGDGDSGDGDSGDGDSGDGDSGGTGGGELQYEAQALPGGLDRIRIEQRQAGHCIRITLVYPLTLETGIATPENWSVESMTYDPSMICTNNGIPMRNLAGAITFGMLDDLSLYPCSLSVDVQGIWEGETDPNYVEVMDLEVMGVTCI